jgi:hypothetical protein
MNIVAKTGLAIQTLFGTVAEEAGRATRVIIRKRKFTCFSLAKTFVLGYLQKPNATDDELAQMAVQCGASVTAQAIDQRHTPQMVSFCKELFCGALKQVVAAKKALAPILERFPEVRILDSMGVTLPDGMESQYRGCGGSYGGGKAALKLQTELDLRSGALLNVQIEPGRSPDSASSRQGAKLPAGSLRIADLGYFNLAVFAMMAAAKVFFLSRLQFGVKVFRSGGVGVDDILLWLSRQKGPIVDQAVLLGGKEKLPARLIAWRLPQEQANRRRQKLREETKRKRNQEPSAERLAWCDWTILVTSVPEEMLSPKEAIVLYRARWQIELLFKRWKSQDLVATLSGSTEVRQMVRVWARLTAAVVQHWLVVTCSWGDPSRSWGKVSEAIRYHITQLAAALNDPFALERLFQLFIDIVAKTCRRNKRKDPGTLELLNDVDCLTYA